MMSDVMGRRLPAEWEEAGAVMLSWPHKDTDWSYMLDEVTECFTHIAEAIVREVMLVVVAPDLSVPQKCLAHLPQDRILYLEVATDDTWARDFGPIVTRHGERPEICDFKFNGWGLKFRACHDNLVTRRMVESSLLRGDYANHLGFVLEGGSIESDGNGLLLTTSECLMSPNRNGAMARDDISAYLSDVFGLKKILWLDHGFLAGDDTDSHIDTLARLAPHDTIVYVGTPDDAGDPHYEALSAMKKQLMEFTTIEGQPFNLIELPFPDPIYDEDGERLPATYANFLILPKAILMPTYNQPQKDLLASQILKIAFPGHDIHKIDCRALIKQHGSLHCVTMQLPKDVLPI